MIKIKSGIYCIENLVNGKKYIGQSVNIKDRLNKHKNLLSKNKHPNKYLQYSYNKYGIENFKFYSLEKCLDEILNEREKYYIKLFNTCDENFGFNMTYGGDSFKMSPKRLEQHTLTKQKLEGRTILSIDCTTGEIKEYISRGFVCRENNYSFRVIAKCLTKDIPTGYGKIWFYADEFELIKDNFDYKEYMYKGKKHKNVLQYDLNGNYIKEWKTANEAGKNGFCRVAIANCCKGNAKTHKGFVWKYKMDE